MEENNTNSNFFTNFDLSKTANIEETVNELFAADPVLQRQSTEFSNRLIKRYKHLKKWAKRTGVNCYRLYDKDIPEIPLAVDLYQGTPMQNETVTGAKAPAQNAEEPEKYLHIALYQRPYQKDQNEEENWLKAMTFAAKTSLEIPFENIFVKYRKKQRGENAQYEKFSTQKHLICVKENDLHFKVNLSDYLDTGLFFDHRPLREQIKYECAGKDVLNLFCYTGSFSCYAALGKAKSVDSVDLSKTYLDWNKQNFALNGFDTTQKVQNAGKTVEKYRFIQEDAVNFVQSAAKADEHKALRCRWDLIILDPPTFSNSKRLKDVFDINRDWHELVNSCLKCLNPGGKLYFSTNSTKLKFEGSLVSGTVSDITDQTVPEDFRNRKIHRCWLIQPE